MAKCDICGKGVTFGIKMSHSHRRANRTWKPNVRKVKAVVNGSVKSVYVCTRCLRSGKVVRAVWDQYLWRLQLGLMAKLFFRADVNFFNMIKFLCFYFTIHKFMI